MNQQEQRMNPVDHAIKPLQYESPARSDHDRPVRTHFHISAIVCALISIFAAAAADCTVISILHDPNADGWDFAVGIIFWGPLMLVALITLGLSLTGILGAISQKESS